MLVVKKTIALREDSFEMINKIAKAGNLTSAELLRLWVYEKLEEFKYGNARTDFYKEAKLKLLILDQTYAQEIGRDSELLDFTVSGQ